MQAGWSADSLVALGLVEHQLGEEFAGGGANVADVVLLDEQQNVGSGVGSPHADVVQPPVALGARHQQASSFSSRPAGSVELAVAHRTDRAEPQLRRTSS